MLEKIILLASLMITVNCVEDNQPKFDPTKKVFNCTDGMAATDICPIRFVVEALTSMTYYNITNYNDSRNLKGYRARFQPDGSLTLVNNSMAKGYWSPPIQADGYYRPIITINAQMPGPMIIAHKNQTLHITVYNELTSIEGISIHWHGMLQKGTQTSDGVAFITQRPIPPNGVFIYEFQAYPPGTYWYHSHAGAQRSDGLYGALIVKDTIPNVDEYSDMPDQHTLLLMDWQRESSINLFYSIASSLRFWKETADEYIEYISTHSSDRVEVGALPFWSAIINDKGRHYNESGQTNIKPTSLNYFTVSQGQRYRFRLIGAQAVYGLRVSIEGHKMTVVATDGNLITPIEDVDSVIVNNGERYDVIVHANASTPEKNNFWIWAETLEDANTNNQNFYSPINKHRAEAILHYDGNDHNAKL